MDNYNYPMGSDTPDAPWNQPDFGPVNVDVVVSQTLSKNTTIAVNDYDVEEWEDWDTGDEGEVIHDGGINYDFSDTNFVEAYYDSEYTPLQLLEEFKYLLNWLDGRDIPFPEHKRKQLIDACNDWTEDELIVEKD